jgi:hypothetical protein
MDKRFIIDRVRTDLRNDIYELMTHSAYHALEKDLTESLINATPLYIALRAFSRNSNLSPEAKEDRRALFAFIIYREMNIHLGGFHFDRYKSLSSGELQDRLLMQVLESLDFNKFLAEYDHYVWLKNDREYPEFVESRQYRNLEDSITSGIKKNKVIPSLGRAIAQDIVDALHLDEKYQYVRISESEKQRVFDFPPQELHEPESLKKITIAVDDEVCSVMLKRCSRTSDQFRYLITDFGALIKGL